MKKTLSVEYVSEAEDMLILDIGEIKPDTIENITQNFSSEDILKNIRDTKTYNSDTHIRGRYSEQQPICKW